MRLPQNVVLGLPYSMRKSAWFMHFHQHHHPLIFANLIGSLFSPFQLCIISHGCYSIDKYSQWQQVNELKHLYLEHRKIEVAVILHLLLLERKGWKEIQNVPEFIFLIFKPNYIVHTLKYTNHNCIAGLSIEINTSM